MTDLQAIHRAILDEPEEDVHRLAYADALDEQGDTARAEFIRDQVLRLPGSNDIDWLDGRLETWCPWLERHDQIGFGRDHAIVPGALRVAHICGSMTWWHRGFVARVACTSATWKRLGNRLVKHHPITAVRLTDREPNPVSAYRGVVFHWCAPGGNRLMRASELPAWLGEHIYPFNLLATKTDREQCRVALSDVCLAWARTPAKSRSRKASKA